MKQLLQIVVFLLLCVGMLHAATHSQNTQRPLLVRTQGNVFGYSMPKQWHATETANGIDLAAGNDLTGVSVSFVLGMFGYQTPMGHFQQVLSSVPLSGIKILSRQAIPPVPGPFGLQWQGVEVEFEALSNGSAIHVRALSHVLQGNGQYMAMLSAIQSPVSEWEKAKDWLPYVRDTIVITNPSVAAGSLSKGLPKGIRHDDIYGEYNKAWSQRSVTSDMISRSRREGTMGYTRQEDPQTGQVYEIPLEDYDATRGGYVNPIRTTELLVPTMR